MSFFQSYWESMDYDPIQCTYLPPSMMQHFSAGHLRPTSYIYFLSIGALMVLIIACVIIPRCLEFWTMGIKTRDELNLIITPFSHTAYRLMVFFPLFSAIAKYWTLLSPVSAYVSDFLIHCYEGILLFFFAKLIIIYLGTLENASHALLSHKATKFYAVPPFGCCLKACISSTNMRHKDFRCLYYLIIQFVVLTPLLSYNLLVLSFQEHSILIYTVTIIDVVSSMLCVYALFALMTAAHCILHQHKIHHKFWCIKLLVMIMIFPNLIITFIKGFFPPNMAHANEMYSNEVMVAAYAAFTQLILFTILSFFFKKYFHINDAIYAHKNHTHKSHKIRYSQVDIKIIKNDIELRKFESLCYHKTI